ncbi:protein LEG1 homolog [Leptodactylus fuscus]
MLSFLFLVLAFGSVIPYAYSYNESYPPMWELVPESLNNFTIHNDTVTINPWDYLQRMALYKILLNVTAPFLDMKEPDNKKNVLWGLPLQLGWQMRTGRLQVPSKMHSEDQTSISAKSWWACMNYYLAVIPFLAAADAGLFEGFPYGIVITQPDEFRYDFCYSIEGCRSTSTKAMDEWKTFFEVIRTLSSDVAKEEDNILSYMWRAHVQSINVALPRCSSRLQYFSGPEGSFGQDWATAVEFLAAAYFPTDFQSTNEFQRFLPPRVLAVTDKAPHIPDFSEQQNRVLSILHAIHQTNTITGGFLLRLWKKAMCSEEGRIAGQKLLQNMMTDPQLVPETMIKIIIELVKNSTCKVQKKRQN